MKKICPIRFDRPCAERTCGWWDDLNSFCMVMTIGSKLFDINSNIRNISDTYEKIIYPEKEFIK
jgi:hypothetical protein